MGYGATQDDWNTLDLILGATRDLLPVVSNPAATVAPGSTLRDIGKVPSLYNRDGRVVGMAKWTAKEATTKDIERWMKVEDYGICFQTREWRAFDIDVDDAEVALRIADTIVKHYFPGAPVRFRQDSGRLLVVVRAAGELSKQTFKVKDGAGIVELLATGQQFIAFGTHPKGARYEWRGSIDDAYQDVGVEAVQACFDDLAKMFADGEATTSRTRKRDPDLDITDDEAAELEELGLVTGHGPQGQFFIDCPFAEGHSTGEAGDTSTAYFPAGTGGYEQGHYACLHASCQHRDDGDFRNALGIGLKDFAVVETPKDVDTVEPLPLPNFDRKKSTGKILSILNNVVAALRRPDICGFHIGFDEFNAHIKIAEVKGQWRDITDVDYIDMRARLEQGAQGFEPIGREIIRDATLRVANTQRFDSGQVWLNSLKWDGVPRVERFCAAYLKTIDTPYTRSVARYIWTALAGRIAQPGVKADMVPVFIGEQGSRKSTAVEKLPPSHEFFADLHLGDKDDDQARMMKGKIAVEFAELKGLHSRDAESIKAFITKTHDTWVPKYQEHQVQYARRLVLFGTSNESGFLADETGNRRWLPLNTGMIDIDALVADRDQLWAEGAVLFAKGGVDWTAEELARVVHGDHRLSDSWEETVGRWLEEPEAGIGLPPGEREFLQIGEVLIGALGFDAKHIKRAEEMRVARVLASFGYEKRKKWVDGRAVNAWERTFLV